MSGSPEARAICVALFLAACGEDDAGPAALDEALGFTVEVTVELDPPREPFKVDGRMEALYALAPPFAGESRIDVVVLPAGETRATTPVRFPTQPGRLRLREITFSPGAPFLCGDGGVVDPRADRAVRVGVRLCFP
ncbi:MAG: hypothetical protein ACRELU_05655 [Gemmatimonadota bacterium]